MLTEETIRSFKETGMISAAQIGKLCSSHLECLAENEKLRGKLYKCDEEKRNLRMKVANYAFNCGWLIPPNH